VSEAVVYPLSIVRTLRGRHLVASSEIEAIDAFIASNLDASIRELSDFCSQPSISARGEGLEETAVMLQDMLRQRGLQTQIIATSGAPVVYGDSGGNGPTLLLYNHYDVQPPEPLELWDSPPFEPTLVDGKLRARGVADDKGEIACRLAAIDAILATLGHFPCRLKFVVEGEEEIGSVSLPAFVQEHAELLAADVCLWEGGGVDFKGQPRMMAGMRGILYLEFQVKAISFDGHSGAANLLPNAAWRLAWALNSLKGPDEVITVEGFYDSVVGPTSLDLELLRRNVDVEQERAVQELMGIDHYLGGKSGLDAARQVFLPTANIAGFHSGYGGEGSKTIIPSEARAKMDFRLVPDQDPYDIAEKVRKHLDEKGFADVEFEILCGEHPGKSDCEDPYLKMCSREAEEVYEQQCKIVPLVGGTGPVHPFMQHLRTPILTAGCGTPTDMVHAPNECLDIAEFERGARHVARILCNVPNVARNSG
jgi:acetylornithine deacetylase/succinyl-diaminopimelate desuccinylase-like protein